MILFSTIIVSCLLLETSSQTPCPDQWYWHGGSCYAFITNLKANWMDAVVQYLNCYFGLIDECAFCQNAHSKLTEIESSSEDQFLRTHLTQSHLSEHFWVGGTDAFAEGEWVWLSNPKQMTYKGWAPGEPNNGVGGACMTLAYHEGFHWNDDHCKNEYDFICEKEV